MTDPPKNPTEATQVQPETVAAASAAVTPSSVPAALSPDDRAAAGKPGESAATLRSVVELVRRVMRSDTASIASLSVAARTVTWKATSGFTTLRADEVEEIVNPLRGIFAEHAAEASDEMPILEVRNLGGELRRVSFRCTTQRACAIWR
jgi:hypothetical protein